MGNGLLPLSVIITAYNVEPYLEQCLTSVVEQELSQNEFEVIIIDDKSTDKSLAISKKYEQAHRNVRVVALPENTPGGVGTPANLGIKLAQGEYIGFVDGDDYVHKEMFSKLLAEARLAQADLAMCGFRLFYDKKREHDISYDASSWGKIFTDEFVQYSELEKKKHYLTLSPVPWRKIYRRNFLRENNILFPVGNFFFEDNPFHWFCIIQARIIRAIDETLIVHRFERAGQTNESDQNTRLGYMIEHLKTIKAFLHRKGEFERYKTSFFDCVISVLADVPEEENYILSGGVLTIFSQQELLDFSEYLPLFSKKI